MQLNTNKLLIEKAIKNCLSTEYPILVTGQDFGDDLANALNVIKVLSEEVVKLQVIVNQLSKGKESEERKEDNSVDCCQARAHMGQQDWTAHCEGLG